MARIFFAAERGEIDQFRASDGLLMKTLETRPVHFDALRVSPTQKYMALREFSDGWLPSAVDVVDLNASKQVQMIRAEGRVDIVEWSGDGSLLALAAPTVAGSAKGITLIESDSWKIHSLLDKTHEWVAARWIPGADELRAISKDGIVQTWDRKKM
jgi:hypothetical protein